MCVGAAPSRKKGILAKLFYPGPDFGAAEEGDADIAADLEGFGVFEGDGAAVCFAAFGVIDLAVVPFVFVEFKSFEQFEAEDGLGAFGLVGVFDVEGGFASGFEGGHPDDLAVVVVAVAEDGDLCRFVAACEPGARDVIGFCLGKEGGGFQQEGDEDKIDGFHID